MTAPTLTDAEIEAIARRYCREMGLDPDEIVWNASPLDAPRVDRVAEEVRDRLAWKIALAGYGEKGD